MRRTLGLALFALTVGSGCGDDDPSPRREPDGGPHGDGDDGLGDGGAGGDGDGETGDDAGAAALGPTSKVRVANTVRGLSFDAWARAADGKPVRVAENLTFGTISDYFDIPVNKFSNDPEFALLPSGERPANATWAVLDGPDRSYITVGELEGPGERASLILSFDEDTERLAYGTLDESELEVGAPNQANLHISYGLFDYPGEAVIEFAVVGMDCFHGGSTNVNQVWSVPAGSFDFGIYDTHAPGMTDCLTGTLLTSYPLEVGAGENELVVNYLDGSTIKVMSAPIALP